MINKYSDIPLYCQLKNLIIEKIESGEYAQDARIPSEQEFVDIYNISRPTVRQAISELTNSGHLYKEKGKGTFVSKSRNIIDIRNYTGFTDSILDSQVPGDRTIISITVLHSSECSRLREIFQLPHTSEAEFAEIKYLTEVAGEVVGLNSSFISLSHFPEIIEDIKLKKPSYDILRGKYPLLPVKSKSALDIIFTEQSDAQYLHIQPGQALIRVENTLYSKIGQVVEFISTKYRTDKIRLFFENSK